MSSLQRFFSPTVRIFDTNIKTLPGALLYFRKAGSSTLKATYQDKAGNTPHANPVVADSTGTFAPIFLSGLYRVELQSSAGVVQPGYPIDNVGQDTIISPFAPWSEIVTYQTDDVVTSPDGDWYRSLIDDNLGDDPDDASGDWELIVIPIAANFTSNVDWIEFADSGNQLSVNVNEANFATAAKAATAPPSVSNYTAATYMYLHDSGVNSATLTISSSFVENTFESVGPTGSGADNIWTALNDLPAGATHAILQIRSVSITTGGTSSALASSSVYAAKGGNGGIISSAKRVFHFSALLDPSSDDQIEHDAYCDVPLNSSRVFDLGYVMSNNTGGSINAFLAGFRSV